MATFTSTRAAASFPVAQSHTAGAMNVAYGTIEVAANPADGDIYQMCKLPANSTIVGGCVYGDDIDTGTEVLDIDIGWAANGGSGTYDSADPDGLGNLDVWTGDPFALGSISIVAGNVFPITGILSDGDLPTFTAETMIQLEANVAANSFTAGAVSVVIYYTND
jgi:hypothetical protein